MWAALRAESIQGGPVTSGPGVVLALWSQIIQDFGLGPQPDTASRLLETDSVERHILRCSATVGTLISPVPSMSGKAGLWCVPLSIMAAESVLVVHRWFHSHPVWVSPKFA